MGSSFSRLEFYHLIAWLTSSRKTAARWRSHVKCLSWFCIILHWSHWGPWCHAVERPNLDTRLSWLNETPSALWLFSTSMATLPWQHSLCQLVLDDFPGRAETQLRLFHLLYMNSCLDTQEKQWVSTHALLIPTDSLCSFIQYLPTALFQ